MVIELLAQIAPAPPTDPDSGTGRLILQIGGVLIGGGLLQLIIFLLKRRAELRTLDTASDATQLTSANEFIAILQADIKVLRAEIETLKKEVDALRKQIDNMRDDAVRSSTSSQDIIERLTLELARARSDVAVLRAQLNQIAHPYDDNPPHRRHGRDT